jgi:hypothetical protein
MERSNPTPEIQLKAIRKLEKQALIDDFLKAHNLNKFPIAN